MQNKYVLILELRVWHLWQRLYKCEALLQSKFCQGFQAAMLCLATGHVKLNSLTLSHLPFPCPSPHPGSPTSLLCLPALWSLLACPPSGFCPPADLSSLLTHSPLFPACPHHPPLFPAYPPHLWSLLTHPPLFSAFPPSGPCLPTHPLVSPHLPTLWFLLIHPTSGPSSPTQPLVPAHPPNLWSQLTHPTSGPSSPA